MQRHAQQAVGGAHPIHQQGLDVVRVGRRAKPLHWTVGEVFVGKILQGDVLGYLEQHRAGTAVTHLAEGTAHHFRDALDRVDLRRPLGDALVMRHRVEVGMHLVSP